MSGLIWSGDKVLAKIKAATAKGIDRTMSEAVQYAKNHHPGWNNKTGTAEGSIRVVKFAEEREGLIVGQWGSVQVNYFIWLELKHGSALRNAADVIYPNLAGHIQRYFQS